MLPFLFQRLAVTKTKLWCLLTVLLASALLNGSNVHAQAPEETPNPLARSVKKVIHEPVHRVAKAANNSKALTNKKLADRVQPSPAVDSIQQDNFSNQKTENLRQGTPAILPSASKPVSDPVDGNMAMPNVGPGVKAKPASSTKVEPGPAPHPLDDALATAKRGLEHIRENVHDYSAIMVKRERVKGKLLDPEYLQVKVRSEGVSDSGRKIPFSVYMKFIKPRANAGREVIWIKGQNNNEICVHEGSGIASLTRLNLDPEGWLAMKGQRYPIYEAGMENLVVKLIEKAERDRAAGNCQVDYRDGVKVNGRECSVIEVTHPEKRAPYDFHIAKVYIDNELRMPIRYQAHIWPEAGSTKPLLLEEYTYLKVKINQGFTDIDFSPDNPKYNYPGR